MDTKHTDKGEEIAITDLMYAAYSSETGILFGIPADLRGSVETIVKIAIRTTDQETGLPKITTERDRLRQSNVVLVQALKIVGKAGSDIVDMANEFIITKDCQSLQNYGANIHTIAQTALAETESEETNGWAKSALLMGKSIRELKAGRDRLRGTCTKMQEFLLEWRHAIVPYHLTGEDFDRLSGVLKSQAALAELEE